MEEPAEKAVESPAMGEKTWPALSDVQRPKTAENSNTDSQVKQIADSHKKSNGGGSGHSSYKHGQTRYHRGGPKRNQNCGPPPFPVSVAYHVYYPQAVPVLPPPIPGHAYGHQPMPSPYPGADKQLGKSGAQIPMKSFGTSGNFQPPAWEDQAGNAPKYSGGRIPNATEADGHMYLWRQPQLPFGPKGGMIMEQNMGPRAYTRPAFFGPARSAPLVRGPAFPGPVRMHYHPMPPRGLNRAPFFPGFAPQLVNPWACGLPPEILALKERIVKQIEYYFSDENLLTDHYLISQMDDQGWVPISVIADFKRVKRMCNDTLFILDALQWSSSVEVQGNKVRKFDDTSKCAVVSKSDTKVKNDMPSEEGTDSTTKGNTGSLPESNSKVKNGLPSEEGTDSTNEGNTGSLSETDSKVDTSSSDNDKFDGSVDNAVVTTVEIECPMIF